MTIVVDSPDAPSGGASGDGRLARCDRIRADIAVWQTARTNAAQGKSISITTSAGTRMITYQNIKEIESTLQRLQRELTACLHSPNAAQGQHSFALANFNNNAQR